MISRRDMLRFAGAAAMASGIPGVAFARADSDARFVLVILRGAADGLAIGRRMVMATIARYVANSHCLCRVTAVGSTNSTACSDYIRACPTSTSSTAKARH